MPHLSSQDLLDKVQIQCIGLICAEWALLEATVSVAIWDYCDLDRQRGLIVTADLGALAKINMLTALARFRFEGHPETVGKIAAITSEMEALNTERNKVVHNLWAMDAVANRMRAKRMTARVGKLKETSITKTTDELMAIYQRITAAIANLEDFQKDHGVRSPSRSK